MFRHIVMLRWKPEADAHARASVREALLGMRTAVPAIRALRWGDNVGRSPNAYDAVVVMDFDGREAFEAYLESDAHRGYVAGPARAAVASLAVIQHE